MFVARSQMVRKPFGIVFQKRVFLRRKYEHATKEVASRTSATARTSNLGDFENLSHRDFPQLPRFSSATATIITIVFDTPNASGDGGLLLLATYGTSVGAEL